MKKSAIIIILIISSMLPLLVRAQAKVQVGEPYGVIDAETKSYILRGKELLTVKVAGNKVYIQKLDPQTLTLVKDNTYEDLPKGFVMEDIMVFNSRCYFFFSYWLRDAKQEQLFYREIDFSNAKFIGEEKLMFTEDNKIAGTLSGAGFYNFEVTDKFDFYTSYDSSKLVIQYRMKPEEKKDSKSYDLIGLKVFGRNMEQVWGDVVQMPYTEKQMDNLDYTVDSEGNAYVLCKVFDDNSTDDKKGKDEDANYHIELLKIVPKKNIESKIIAVNDKFIQTIAVFEGPNDMMYCAGLYNIGNVRSSANGLFMLKLNKDHSIADQKYFEIPLEILNQYESARTQKKNEKNEEKGEAEFKNLELRDLIINNDGSVILVGEQHYITQTTVYTSSGSRTTYHYHYNDVLISKIDPSGKLVWMRKIPKVQVFSSSSYMPAYKGGMSYSLITGANSYYVLFLDNIKNMNLTIDQVPVTHRDKLGGFLTAYKIDYTTGQTTRSSLFDVRDVEGMSIHQFSTGRLIQTASSEFVLEAYKKGKEDILIKVNMQ
ncbi:MAG TPA: hypothetical protein VNB90_03600 [Cytophagaceae bacterium]|nr:hypothetical protein [Cytophagaceae bacterium]